MIEPDQVVNGVWVATVLILLGLVPGLYQSLVEALSVVARQLVFLSPVPLSDSRVPPPMPQPCWLTLAGAAILFLTVALYAI
jgi:hypothetical protein